VRLCEVLDQFGPVAGEREDRVDDHYDARLRERLAEQVEQRGPDEIVRDPLARQEHPHRGNLSAHAERT